MLYCSPIYCSTLSGQRPVAPLNNSKEFLTMTLELQTTNHNPRATSDEPRTTSAQKKSIMQNKPNFPRFCAKNTGLEEKQTQFKPNSNTIKANSNPILSQMRRKQTQSNQILNPSRAAVPQFWLLIFFIFTPKIPDFWVASIFPVAICRKQIAMLLVLFYLEVRRAIRL